MNARPSRERGLGALSNLLIILVLAAVVLAGMKIAPYYLEYFKVQQVIEGLKGRPEVEGMPADQIRRLVEKQLYIDEVRRLSADNISVKRSATQVLVDVKYEVREHLVGNIDFVLSFAHALRLNY